jgi:hypothetical protein
MSHDRPFEIGLFTFGEMASPAVVLAAIAEATQRIRLTSTVTVLSTADPLKVFEDFVAVDLISGGRAEITAGRGAYTESFPLFGHDLVDYDELFDEKLDLLLRLNHAEHVTWTGRHRAALDNVGVYPRPVQSELPVWIAVGGTPASVERAGRHGLPLYLAILGQPERFAPLAELYRETAANAGQTASASVSPATSTSSQHPKALTTPSIRTTRATSVTTCPGLVANFFPVTHSMPGQDRAAHCSPAAPNRSSTRFFGNTNCSATTAFSPRSVSEDFPSQLPRAPSNSSPPKSFPPSDAKQRHEPQ